MHLKLHIELSEMPCFTLVCSISDDANQMWILFSIKFYMNQGFSNV